MSSSNNLPDILVKTIAVAATATSYFERVRLFDRCADVTLGAALSCHESARSFARVEVTSAIRNYTLENVVLDTRTLLLFQNGYALPETAYFEPAEASRHLSARVDPMPVSDSEDLIFGYNNAHLGYQHWLTQCIPAIDWSLQQPRTRDVRLLLPPLEAWQEDFLDILGYSAIPRLTLKPGTHYHLPKVEFSDFLNGTTSFGISLSLLDTAKRILQAVPISGSTAKVLYVPGLSSYYGPIRNENQVMDLLRSRGVHIVSRDLGTADRINLFRQADVVIGPLGQGLTDVLFCQPNALLWEWMPRHHQNASFNRLAQAAQVDYWGDLFECADDPQTPGEWEVDVAAVAARLSEIDGRLAQRAIARDAAAAKTRDAVNGGGRDPVSVDRVSQPLDELMLKFESIGDNCEFGLVQRLCGAEPLGLLRFAGFYLPVEIRLQKLVAALERGFEGLAEADTINVHLAGDPGRREFIVRESAYGLMYHTFIPEGAADPKALHDAEVKRLRFLRRKLLEDLAGGEKIWVWRSPVTSDVSHVKPLADILRRLGPNILLWVVEADDEHAAGTIEVVEPGLIKGYVRRLAPYMNAADIHLASWLEVCTRTHELCARDRTFPDCEQPGRMALHPPSAGNPVACDARITIGTGPLPIEANSAFSRLWRWLRRRSSSAEHTLSSSRTRA
jgi:capsular polysaccharide biosynthesis protein